jgi:HAD superfamily hydrolase (TIGR01549 family)
MAPRFFYFDLGKVIVDFSVERMCRQMGDAAGVDPGLVRQVVFDGDLQRRYERGQITTRQFYDEFCQLTVSHADFDRLLDAANDIFDLNASVVPVLGQLQAARYRMGILSNTCEGHWRHCLNRYRVLRGFQIYLLSYEVGATKPDAEIFQAAARAACVPPEEIFYTDDMPGHVAGAQAVGIDAVLFTSAAQLAADLRRRGVRFNY